MSTVDDKLENWLVNKVGIPQESVDDAKEIIAWVSTAGSVVAFVIAAYKLYNALFGSGKPDPVRQILDKLTAQLATDKLSDVIAEAKQYAAAIDSAGVALQTFIHSPVPSAETRGVLIDKLGVLDATLHALLQGQSYRFIPKAYAYHDPEHPGAIAKTPGWVNGYPIWGDFYHYYTSFSFSGEATYSSPAKQLYQVYQQENTPLPYNWYKPQPLWQDTNRWDGRFCLPLIMRGLAVWQLAIARLEPFYQLTGHWSAGIDALAGKMLMEFAKQWSEQVLWVREMPTEGELADDGMHLVPLSSEPPYAGFHSWPCGVLDPVMGVEIINPTWWKADGGPPEMPTEWQRTKFKELRLQQHMKLETENQFAAFVKLATGVSKLRLPPAISPSLKVHPELLESKHPGSGPLTAMPIVTPHQEQVTDAFGNVWTATVRRSSVIVTAPISVQPNPTPSTPPGTFQPSRRAASDVVFGYEISVTATGGKKQKAFQWPLRLSAPFPSLYHQSDNVGSNRKVPYQVEQEFTDPSAATWITATDGESRGKANEAKGSPVYFKVVVQVADQEPPRIPGDLSDPYGLSWGTLWVRIEADEKKNQGRSFEVTVEITETVPVDAMGHREYKDPVTGEKDPKFSHLLKQYTQQMRMPVDICTATVPSNFFQWLKHHLHVIRENAHRHGIPVPRPEPELELELAILRRALESNPVLLQSHVHSFRQLTGQPALSAEEVIGRLGITEARHLER